MSKNTKENHTKFNIILSSLQTDMVWIKNEIIEIKENHLAHLKEEMDKLYGVINTRLPTSDQSIENIKNIQKEIGMLKDRINSRLPIWITMIFGLLTMIIGWLISVKR